MNGMLADSTLLTVSPIRSNGSDATGTHTCRLAEVDLVQVVLWLSAKEAPGLEVIEGYWPEADMPGGSIIETGTHERHLTVAKVVQFDYPSKPNKAQLRAWKQAVHPTRRMGSARVPYMTA